MGFILDLITLPVLGAPKMVHWLTRTLGDEAQRELLDENRIRGELLELQELYEAGAVGEEEYDRQERALLEWLKAARAAKAQQSQGG